MTYAAPAEAPEIMAFAAGMWSAFAKAQDDARGRAGGCVGAVLSRSPMRVRKCGYILATGAAFCLLAN